MVPAPRAGHTATVDVDRGAVLVFGGASREDGFYNDIFRLDISTYTWERLSVGEHIEQEHLEQPRETALLPINMPCARYEHAAVMASRTAWQSRNRLVVLFGAGADGPLSDTWAFDVDALRWERLAVRGVTPLPRTLHSVGLVRAPGKSDRIFAFGGGIQSNIPVPDTAMYCLDMDRLFWAKVHSGGDSDAPQARLGHAICAIGSKTYKWTRLETRGDVPTARCAHTTTVVGTWIVLYGGMAWRPAPCGLDEIYVLDTESLVWRVINAAHEPPAAPGPRIDHDAFLIGPNRIGVFGGMDFTGTFNDFFELTL
eukprot:jgi/Hompol1/3172/HPOL_003146-RA